MTPRATPLPPEERRASILAAARPLLVQHGADFTTKQVAEAAGIAEGTIFRIFPTKRDLVRALIEQALDPAEAIAELGALPVDQTLPERATAIVTLLTSGIDRVSEVFAALRTMPHTDGPGEHGQGPGHHRPPPHGRPDGHTERGLALRAAVAEALAPYAAELTTSPQIAARLLHVVAFAASHPLLNRGEPLAPETLAHVLLTGLARRDDQENPC